MPRDNRNGYNKAALELERPTIGSRINFAPLISNVECSTLPLLRRNHAQLLDRREYGSESPTGPSIAPNRHVGERMGWFNDAPVAIQLAATLRRELASRTVGAEHGP